MHSALTRLSKIKNTFKKNKAKCWINNFYTRKSIWWNPKRRWPDKHIKLVTVVRAVINHRTKHIYLDHGNKRHDPLHVFLQLRQSSQLTCNHFVVRESSVVALQTPPKKWKNNEWHMQPGTPKSHDHGPNKWGCDGNADSWTLHPHLVMLAEQG